MRKAILASVLMLAISVPSDASDRPDVLFIAVDDLNTWVGAMAGHPQTRTPNIDALAARGMLFTNAHTPGAACLPARTAILTGVSAFTSGIYSMRGDWRENPRLSGNHARFPGYFRDNGYSTRGAGKIFHAHSYSLEGFRGQQDPCGMGRLLSVARSPLARRGVPRAGADRRRRRGQRDQHGALRLLSPRSRRTMPWATGRSSPG